MKKKTSLFLLSLTLVLAMLLSGCGQSQISESTTEVDSTVNTPTVDTNTPADEPEAPEDSHVIISDIPTETDAPTEAETPTEESDAIADGGSGETPDTAGNAPEISVSAPEGSAPSSEPEPAQTATPIPEQNSDPAATPEPVTPEPEPVTPETAPEPGTEPEPAPVETPASSTTLSGTNLTLRFGGGEEFTIHMYDNDTANKIAEYVGTASWQLPIYHFDDYDGWESFQYYDIPSRYDIPDGSRSVTSEKAGAVYYSHPNRIILFYQDADISSEYTPVGYVDFSQDLVDAVENNPVVEGWGNKLIFIQP